MSVEQATLETADQPLSLVEAPAKSGEAVTDETVTKESATGELTEADRLERTERLLNEHQEVVFRYAYRLTGCASTAEDIAQEVFLRAFRGMHQLRDDSAARSWLLVIARNEFARWCRKAAGLAAELDPLACETLGCTDEPALERSEWVNHALQQLPADFRLVLLMYYFEELSYAEIAEQLDIPVGTVMSRLSRGKSHLKAALVE